MSYYYFYGVQVDFNFWMVVAPAAFVLMVLFGLKQYEQERQQIVRVFDDVWYMRLTAVVTIVLTVMLIVESGDGIIQLLDNQAARNGLSSAYAWQSVAGMPLVAAAIACMYGFLLYFVGRVAGLAKAGWLYCEMKRWRYERWKSQLVRNNEKYVFYDNKTHSWQNTETRPAHKTHKNSRTYRDDRPSKRR